MKTWQNSGAQTVHEWEMTPTSSFTQSNCINQARYGDQNLLEVTDHPGDHLPDGADYSRGSSNWTNQFATTDKPKRKNIPRWLKASSVCCRFTSSEVPSQWGTPPIKNWPITTKKMRRNKEYIRGRCWRDKNSFKSLFQHIHITLWPKKDELMWVKLLTKFVLVPIEKGVRTYC